MKKSIRLITALVLGAVAVNIPAANAATPVVTDVGAYFKVENGWFVSWTLPADKTGVTGYTVVASNGAKCIVTSPNINQCLYSSTTIPNPFKPLTPYTFSVVTNTKSGDSAASAPSNVAKWVSAPGIGSTPLANVVSDTQVDITWVPSVSDGGLSLYGYKVTYWEAILNAYGDPNGATQKDFLTVNTFASLTGLKPSTWYVINVSACNALGCTANNTWRYVATTPKVGAALTWRPPTMISGGTASTTCWKATWDGGTAAAAGSVIKSSTACPGMVINPANYPKVDPTATIDQVPSLVNKLNQNIFFGGWQNQYSMSAFAKTGGLPWFAYLSLTSKSYMRGFIIEPVLVSNTPKTCSIDGKIIRFLAVGTCTVTASAPGNSIWLPSRAMTNSFYIVA